MFQSTLLSLIPLFFVAEGFQPLARPHGSRITNASRRNVYVDGQHHGFSAPLSVDHSLYDAAQQVDLSSHQDLPVDDPSLLEFAPTEEYAEEASKQAHPLMEQIDENDYYSVATMMQCSTPYIACHMGQVAVFHLPGDILEDPRVNDLLSDMALSWLLGIKIVIVVGSRYDLDVCELDDMMSPHECNNMLKVTDKDAMRSVQEDAGFLRTEVERLLNRYMRMHAGVTCNSDLSGYVVSGNFYTAKQFGTLQGNDYEYTGYASEVNSDSIQKVMGDNDVVLLSTVGLTRGGELVNVNGYHLAASVAGAMNAHKLIYMQQQGSVLQKKNEHTPIQELPLSFAKAILDYHQVKCYNTGFASFEQARKNLEPRAVELLLHLGWATWAMEHGVQRAHIVNPADGALLEELFTSKNGVNTCLYHDKENEEPQDDLSKDFEDFLAVQNQDAYS